MDKFVGSLAGLRRTRRSDGGEIDNQLSGAEDAFDNASVDETLMSADHTTAFRAALSLDGQVCWIPVRDSMELKGIYRRTIAQSQMSSMLKDAHRNGVYEKAIGDAVASASLRLGRPPVVLDIGAGTGLLSLMAARAGAREVHAVEQWREMADVARSVIAANEDRLPATCERIVVHAKHSTSLQLIGDSSTVSILPGNATTGGSTSSSSSNIGGIVSAALDEAYLTFSPDLVVSEILDSALLGEGVVPSLRDAYARLAFKGAPCPSLGAGETMKSTPPLSSSSVAGGWRGGKGIPSHATVFARLAYSPQFSAWQSTDRSSVGGMTDVSHEASSSSSLEGNEGRYSGDAEAAIASSAVPLTRKDWTTEACKVSPIAVPVQISHLSPPPKYVTDTFVLHSQGFLPKDLLPVVDGEGDAAAGPSSAAGTSSGQTEKVIHVPSHLSSTSTGPIVANAVIFWWTCDMGGEKDAELLHNNSSASPTSTDPSKRYCTCPPCVLRQGWQDHWTQCVIPLGSETSPSSGNEKGGVGLASPSGSVAADINSGISLESRCWSSVPLDSITPSSISSSSSSSSSFSSSSSSFSSASESTASPQSSFSVWISCNDLSLRVCIGPKGTEFWPSKLSRTRAIKANKTSKEAPGPLVFTEPEACTCGLHGVTSFERRWALNDSAWIRTLEEGVGLAVQDLAAAYPSEPLIIVSLGEQSLCGLIAAKQVTSIIQGKAGFFPGTTYVCCIEESRKAAVHTEHLLGASFPRPDSDDEEEEEEEDKDGGHAFGEAGSKSAAISSSKSFVESKMDVATSENNNASAAAFESPSSVCAFAIDLSEGASRDLVSALSEHLLPLLEPSASSSPRGIHALLMEPIYAGMHHLPLWCCLLTWMRRSALECVLRFSGGSEGTQRPHILPYRAHVRAQAVNLPTLASHSHGLVGDVCGFDHAPFDEVERIWHEPLYSYPLWQYDVAARSDVKSLAVFDFSAPAPFIESAMKAAASVPIEGSSSTSTSPSLVKCPPVVHEVHLDVVEMPADATAAVALTGIHASGAANAVVIWVDYDLDDAGTCVLSTSAKSAPHQRQHVKFLARDAAPGSRIGVSLSLSLHASEAAATPVFDFSVKTTQI